MNLQQIPSKLLEDAVNEFSRLPGIGKKTALRLVLHLLYQPADEAFRLANSITDMKENVKICPVCHNIADGEMCNICSNNKRNHELICVVETIKELIAIESTGQYNGVYHVLGGRISPMDGIGPRELNIGQLENRVKNNIIAEVILALSTNMEGDTTAFYIYRKLNPYNVTVSNLARGISIGDEIEHTDEITLARSLLNRTPYTDK